MQATALETALFNQIMNAPRPVKTKRERTIELLDSAIRYADESRELGAYAAAAEWEQVAEDCRAELA